MESKCVLDLMFSVVSHAVALAGMLIKQSCILLLS